jgi:NAD dependent epimerase/dehydratase family enzyme
VGGSMGSGRQWMSWVTLEDVVGILRHTLDDASVSGAVNVVAPQPVRNAEFTRELARTLHRPAIFPAPAFALRLALGQEMADSLLLASQRVEPARLADQGYHFLHRDLHAALAAVLA